MSDKHTPGPWTIKETGTRIHQLNVIGDSGVWIADANPFNKHKEPTGEMMANARLIAAATELLGALTECDKAFASWQVGQIPGRPEDILALISKVRAAIAKAEGR